MEQTRFALDCTNSCHPRESGDPAPAGENGDVRTAVRSRQQLQELGSRFRGPYPIRRSKIPGPRLVPLDRTLLGLALQLERDEVTRLASNLVHAPLHHAFACVDGGVLVGAGGLAPVWFGRAEAWMLVSGLARPRQIVAGIRLARAWLDRKCTSAEFRRLELFVRAAAPWRQSFVAALGFSPEGHLLRCWGPDGADHVLHERISHSEGK